RNAAGKKCCSKRMPAFLVAAGATVYPSGNWSIRQKKRRPDRKKLPGNEARAVALALRGPSGSVSATARSLKNAKRDSAQPQLRAAKARQSAGQNCSPARKFLEIWLCLEL